MKGQTITALKQQRVFIQIQLHEQRALMLAQLCQQNHSAVEFPRSETMRFLSGKIGMNFIAEQTIGCLLKRNGFLLYIAQSVRRLLIK